MLNKKGVDLTIALEKFLQYNKKATSIKEPLDLVREFKMLSPLCLDDFMEDLQDKKMLSVKGKIFAKEFWRLFIKE